MSSCRRWGARRCARSPTSSDATVAPRFSSSSTRSSRGRRGSTPTTATSRSFPQGEVRRLTDRGARRGRDVHPRLHLVGDADPGASPLGAESAEPARLRPPHGNEPDRRPRQRVSPPVEVRQRVRPHEHASDRGPAALRKARSEPPVRLLPAPVTEDFKVKRVIHCADQEYIVKQVADALPQELRPRPQGAPVSIGRNPSGMLRRLTQRENVRLVSPYRLAS